jgi:hypothetical protein
VLVVSPVSFSVVLRWIHYFPLVGCVLMWLYYRGLSPCVLIDFPGLGAVGFVCSGGRLCLDVAFTSGRGKCLHTTLGSQNEHSNFVK